MVLLSRVQCDFAIRVFLRRVQLCTSLQVSYGDFSFNARYMYNIIEICKFVMMIRMCPSLIRYLHIIDLR